MQGFWKDIDVLTDDPPEWMTLEPKADLQDWEFVMRDDLKLELFENISEVEAGLRKSQEESPENQELGELARRMGELGAGIVTWQGPSHQR